MGWFAVAFLIGHCCVHFLPELPEISYALVLLIAITLAAAMRSILLIALALGIAWAWANAAARMSGDLPGRLEGVDLIVQGHIRSLPETDGSAVQFVFDVTAAEPGVPDRVRLAWYEAPLVPQVGEAWQFVVRLKKRNGFANPGGFDYEAHLLRAGIGATGYVRTDERNRRLAPPSARYAITRVRAWIAERMAAAMSDRSMLGVLQGLAIGDTREMSAEQWKVFAATGTTHLMAISGLHITMIATLAAWLGGGIVRLPNAQARGWCAVHGRVVAGACAAIVYCLLAGLSIPTQRTLIMLCIYFGARVVRRELPIAHSLGLAAIGVLLVDPFAPLTAGAWLSFGAVAAILLATSGRLCTDGIVRGFTRVQLAITVGLLPLLASAFGSLSLISPLANAVAVPFFTLIVVPLVLLGALGAALAPAIGSIPLDLATLLLQALWVPLRWLADQPGAVWYFAALPSWSLLALTLGAGLLVLPGLWLSRVLGTVLCLQALVVQPPRPEEGQFELAVLDVGQGLATVVRTREHALVYDAGPAFQSGRDAAELAVLPYLRSRGMREIHMLVVSHGDLDHQGGVPTLLHALPPARSLAGPSVSLAMPRRVTCLAGQRWSWDGVQFDVLHPQSRIGMSENDSSCVIRIEGKWGSALLTGDIEQEGERAVLQRGVDRVDLAVVAHHGSRTSSTPELVERLSPRLAIFSVGYLNRWGLPKADVVERWRRSGARTLTTARSGAIEISFARFGAIEVREYRRSSRRYWFRTEE